MFMHKPTTGDMGDCTDISENTAYPKQLLSNRAYKKEDMKETISDNSTKKS